MGWLLERRYAMQKIGDVILRRRRDDFRDGDHQEYVEGGMSQIFLVGGAAVVLVGAFVVSLF